MYSFILLLFFISTVVQSYTKIQLNSTNVITIRDEIDDAVASQFIYKLNLLQNKNVYVYLDTPGGSIESGNKILMEIQKYNLSCIAERAYSMGFVLLQACNTRYIRPYGKLMQHQISYAIKNEKGKIDNYAKFVDQLEETLLDVQSAKIGLEPAELKLKTMNEWWLIGKYAKENNCVDDIADVFCSHKMTISNYTENIGPYTFVYSNCPLISDPIDIYLVK